MWLKQRFLAQTENLLILRKPPLKICVVKSSKWQSELRKPLHVYLGCYISSGLKDVIETKRLKFTKLTNKNVDENAALPAVSGSPRETHGMQEGGEGRPSVRPLFPSRILHTEPPRRNQHCNQTKQARSKYPLLNATRCLPSANKQRKTQNLAAVGPVEAPADQWKLSSRNRCVDCVRRNYARSPRQHSKVNGPEV